MSSQFVSAVSDLLKAAGIDDATISTIIPKLDLADDNNTLTPTKTKICGILGPSDNAVALAQIQAINAEANSSDQFVSRARPAFLYVFYGFLIVTLLTGVVAMFVPDRANTFYTTVTAFLTALPEKLYWLFGSAYLGYAGARSFDKWQTAKQTSDVGN